MQDLINWLAIVNWPGAAIVCVALVVGACIITECYGSGMEYSPAMSRVSFGSNL